MLFSKALRDFITAFSSHLSETCARVVVKDASPVFYRSMVFVTQWHSNHGTTHVITNFM